MTVDRHADRAELDAYVAGDLRGPRASQLEAHVVACGACAIALERAARFEVALGEVCRAKAPRSARVARIAGVGFASLAAAAAVLLVLGASHAANPALRASSREEDDAAPTASVPSPSLAACADGEPCVADASPIQ